VLSLLSLYDCDAFDKALLNYHGLLLASAWWSRGELPWVDGSSGLPFAQNWAWGMWETHGNPTKTLPCGNHGNIAFYRILSPMVIDFGDDL
jgi:hypothetical protein